METKPNKNDKRTIIREILDSDLPAANRSALTLEQEASTFVAAGTSTVSRVLEAATYYILSPQILSRLKSELQTLNEKSSPLSIRQLENLPYLQAIISESLRLSNFSLARFPRLNPVNSMSYKTHILPPKTVVSMSLYNIMHDPHIFASPQRFRPERWLDDCSEEELRRMRKFLVPFGRGSRDCVGQNLAMAELVLVLGGLFGRYEMSLFKTGKQDVEVVRDCFIGCPREKSEGVRVLVEWR